MNVGGDSEHAEFAYSVGLWETVNTPELIVFGLPSQLMHNMIWDVVHQIKNGSILSEGSRWENLIEGYDCVARKVHESNFREHVGSAMWYHTHRKAKTKLEAFQLFWPGVIDRLYPWDKNSHQSVRDAQPLLYEPYFL